MKRVYFVCVGNSCRSQMAEGFARKLGQNVLEVKSGGTQPASKASSNAVEAMREVGIDISDQEPEGLDTDWVASADYVISMGCGVEESCPAELYQRMVDWDLDDPKGGDLDRYREIRDEIKRRVEDLVELVMEDSTLTGGGD